MNNSKFNEQMKTSFKKSTLPEMARWWKKKSSHDDKGGSFDVQLYMRICEAKNSILNNEPKSKQNEV